MALIWAFLFVSCSLVLGLLHWCTAQRYRFYRVRFCLSLGLLCWVSFIGVLRRGFVFVVFCSVSTVIVPSPLVLGLLHWCTALRFCFCRVLFCFRFVNPVVLCVLVECVCLIFMMSVYVNFKWRRGSIPRRSW